METYTPFGRLTFKSATDIDKHILVGLTSGAVCGAGEKPLGATELSAGAGEAGTVIVSGTALVKAGAAVAKGAKLKSDAAGKVVTHDTGEVAGFALNDAANADDLVLVLLV